MLEILFRHRWRYLVLLVVLPLIGALVCIPLYPKGTASELIWVQDQGLLSTSQPFYEAYLTPAQQTQGNLEQYIQTTTFTAAVYKKLLAQGVSEDQALGLAYSLSSGLVALPTGNNLLMLDYTCDQPSLCPVALSEAWQVYEGYSASNVNSQLKVAEQSYQQQVDQAQQQLDSAQAAVESYLAQHPTESQQTATDPNLNVLLQTVTADQQTLQSAQGKLAAAQNQAKQNQITVSSLYQVVNPSHSQGGHLSRLPTKQMMIAAVLFWALAAISLILTTRLERVVRHPNQLGSALGLDVVAVMQPIPAPTSTSLALPRRSRGKAA